MVHELFDLAMKSAIKSSAVEMTYVDQTWTWGRNQCWSNTFADKGNLPDYGLLCIKLLKFFKMFLKSFPAGDIYNFNVIC